MLILFGETTELFRIIYLFICLTRLQVHTYLVDMDKNTCYKCKSFRWLMDATSWKCQFPIECNVGVGHKMLGGHHWFRLRNIRLPLTQTSVTADSRVKKGLFLAVCCLHYNGMRMKMVTVMILIDTTTGIILNISWRLDTSNDGNATWGSSQSLMRHYIHDENKHNPCRHDTHADRDWD